MTPRVHPSAIVDPSAELDLDVVVEPFAIVGPSVRVGAGSTIGPHATVRGPTRVGAGCSIGIGAVIGSDPQDLKYRGEPTTLDIGEETQIREYVTVNRGTVASGSTVIGRRCLLMSYVHVAHDCRIGDSVILSNAVQLAGHVQIGEHAQVGGLTPVHQFVRIGAYAFVGGGSRVPQDIPPFARTAGNPLRMYGINTIGLRRAGFDAGLRMTIQHAYRVLFNSDLAREEAIHRIHAESGHVPEVALLLEFLGASERGVMV